MSSLDGVLVCIQSFPSSSILDLAVEADLWKGFLLTGHKKLHRNTHHNKQCPHNSQDYLYRGEHTHTKLI